MSENEPTNLKTDYWERKSLSHLKEMRLAKEYGLFPKKEGWRNTVEHLEVVDEVADVLAKATGMPEIDRRETRQAARLHDVYKRRQRELINQKGDKGQIEAAREQDEFVLKHGYSHKVVELINSVGHTSLIKFVKDPKAPELELKEELDLPTLIIHYADDITRGSEVVGIDTRIDAVENRKPPYPEATMGGDIFAGRTYYQVQRTVGHLVENRLASLVGLQPTQLTDFIKSKIDERIIQSSTL